MKKLKVKEGGEDMIDPVRPELRVIINRLDEARARAKERIDSGEEGKISADARGIDSSKSVL